MTYDGSNRKDIRRVEKAARLAERARIDYTRRIMSETLGRAWMHEQLSRCNIFSTPFVRGALDATAFNCGAQNVGLQLFADVVTHCPTQYVMMMQESANKEIAKETADDRHDSNNRDAAGEPARGQDNGRDTEGSIAGEPDLYDDSSEA